MALRNEQVRFCPRCGTRTERRELFGAERPVCPGCGWMYFSDPKVAAAALVESDGRALLVRRVNEPFRGLWTLPAGFVNGGEDPAEAAARECLEETGLRVRIVRVLDVIFGQEHERGADFVIIYLAEALGGELRAADDADAAGWFARGEIPPLAFEATKKALAFLFGQAVGDEH